jgi:hypothetical protein
MDGNESKGRRSSRRRQFASAGLVAGGLLVGATLAGSQIASAQSTSSTTSASATASTANQRPDPVTVTHGPGETLLTDGTASKVKAAALAAVPGGTIIRVETDSAGSPYEAHVRTSGGSIVTVKVDNDFKVTDTESGFGAGGPAPSGGTGA